MKAIFPRTVSFGLKVPKTPFARQQLGRALPRISIWMLTFSLYILLKYLNSSLLKILRFSLTEQLNSIFKFKIISRFYDFRMLAVNCDNKFFDFKSYLDPFKICIKERNDLYLKTPFILFRNASSLRKAYRIHKIEKKSIFINISNTKSFLSLDHNNVITEFRFNWWISVNGIGYS